MQEGVLRYFFKNLNLYIILSLSVRILAKQGSNVFKFSLCNEPSDIIIKFNMDYIDLNFNPLIYDENQ